MNMILSLKDVVRHTYRLAQYSLNKVRRIVRVLSAFSCSFVIERLPRELYKVYQSYRARRR
jgi:hypothetical protein